MEGKISFVTPLMGVNKGSRNRNWNVLYRHLYPLLNGNEWVVPEQGSKKGHRLGTKKIPVYGTRNRSQMRNIGWRHASHDMICFMDSDVVMEHSAWRNAFDKCWEFDCYSPYVRGVYLGPTQTNNRLKAISEGKWNFKLPRSRKWNLCGGICFMRRHVLESFDGWDERFNGWGYEDIAIEKLVRVGGFRWHLDRRHLAIHLFHPTQPKKRSQGKRMRKLYVQEYSCRKFEDIVKRKREGSRAMKLPKHLGGHLNRTHVDKGALYYFGHQLECRTMLDVGCGPGGQVKLADLQGWQAKGLDGDDTIKRDIDCEIIDFTKEKYDPKDQEFDLAWCVEFVEHVEEQYIDNYMSALTSANFVFLTHALPGVGGHHHVNCKPPEYWIDKLKEYGFVYSEKHTKGVRAASTMQREFARNTGMVFVKKEFMEELKVIETKDKKTKTAIFWRGGNNPWINSMVKYLKQLGYQSRYESTSVNALDMLTNEDLVVIWNGELRGDKVAARYCREHGIRHFFLELGHFSQDSSVAVSKLGSVGGKLFEGEQWPRNTPEDEQYLDDFFLKYSKGRKRDPGDHVLALLQIPTDTSIKNHSPFKTMQSFIDYVENCFPNDEVIFRQHPKAQPIKLRTRVPIVTKCPLWDHLLTAKLCIGINSTALYEAVLANVPVIALGGCPLNRHPDRHRDIVRELLRRHIPLTGCSDFKLKVSRSTGVDL